jgi:hypothetical protein
VVKGKTISICKQKYGRITLYIKMDNDEAVKIVMERHQK